MKLLRVSKQHMSEVINRACKNAEENIRIWPEFRRTCADCAMLIECFETDGSDMPACELFMAKENGECR